MCVFNEEKSIEWIDILVNTGISTIPFTNEEI